MPAPDSLKKRIKDLYEADAIDEEQREELLRMERRSQGPIRQVFSQLNITARDFFGQTQVTVRCMATRHDWQPDSFDWKYIPCGKPIAERCDRCGSTKVTRTTYDCYYLGATVHHPPGRIGPGRAFTKWEKTTVVTYLGLLDRVTELEGSRSSGGRRLRVVNAG